MGFTDSMVKYILFIMNFLLIVTSIILVGLGSFAIYSIRNIPELLPEDRISYAVPVTATGCVILLISFVGCFGSVFENTILLNTYAVFVVILTVINTCLLIILYRSLSKTYEEIFSLLDMSFQDDVTRTIFFVLEVNRNCCGPSGTISYDEINVPFPPNCCPQFEVPRITSVSDISIAHDVIMDFNGTGDEICTRAEAYGGCIDAFFSSWNSVLNRATNFATITTCVELVACIFAFYLAQHLRNERESKSTYGTTLSNYRGTTNV